VGPSAFREFVQKNKRDFILFQLDVALKDAGSDSNKKAEVVNQIAETIQGSTKLKTSLTNRTTSSSVQRFWLSTKAGYMRW